MKYVKHNEKTVAYTSEGRGKAVVLVHGFCEDSGIWDEFKLDLLEKKYRVVCVDLPGFGGSEVAEGITVAGMAQAVKAVVDHLNLAEIIFIGHSMGGYAALAFADQYPDVLKGLGIFHSHPYADADDKKENRYKHGYGSIIKQLRPWKELGPTRNTKSAYYNIRPEKP